MPLPRERPRSGLKDVRRMAVRLALPGHRLASSGKRQRTCAFSVGFR
jgi:hypothetical protein